MRKILCIIFLLLPSLAFADTHTADSCSVADIGTAITAASAGDTVAFSGNCTWDTQLEITKAITLQGTGTPVITRGTLAAASSLILYSPAAATAMRITGIRFENGTNTEDNYKSSIRIDGSKNNSFLTQIRIDNCYFNKGTRVVTPSGYVYGVIDNNTFNNCSIAVGPLGDSNHAWNRDIEAGTENALFIEKNLFTADEANRGIKLQQQIYISQGIRAVVRYNTLDLSAVTGSGGATFFDSHGNQSSTTPDCADPVSMFRSQPLLEIYNNIFKAGSSSSIISKFMDIRGGSVLIYNNTFTTTSGGAVIKLWEEEADGRFANFSDGPCTEYPWEDMINNSFFWNNTYNGTAIEDIALHSYMPEGSITNGRDYFMAAPAASGQGYQTLSKVATYGYITGSNYGSPMTFTEGASIYYPYTRYTCPHPLVGSGSCDSGVAGTTGYSVSGLGNTFAPWVH